FGWNCALCSHKVYHLVSFQWQPLDSQGTRWFGSFPGSRPVDLVADRSLLPGTQTYTRLWRSLFMRVTLTALIFVVALQAAAQNIPATAGFDTQTAVARSSQPAIS